MYFKLFIIFMLHLILFQNNAAFGHSQIRISKSETNSNGKMFKTYLFFDLF